MNNDRVHACLDGELSREALTPAERIRLEELEERLGETTEALRDIPVPDLTARVMQALPAPVGRTEEKGWSTRLREWLWRPRALTIQYRPAHALAGLAAVAFAAVAVPVKSPGPQPQVAALVSQDNPRMYVQFRLEAPGASRVELAGSFTGWQPTYELRETAPGVWTALVPLEPGVYDYTFVVDGEDWVVDPNAPRVADSFGGSNSRLFLPSPVGSA